MAPLQRVSEGNTRANCRGPANLITGLLIWMLRKLNSMQKAAAQPPGCYPSPSVAAARIMGNWREGSAKKPLSAPQSNGSSTLTSAVLESAC